MAKRRVYLAKKSLADAQEIWHNIIKQYKPETERIKVVSAGARITAEAVAARRSAPHYNAAAMDGIAVKASSTRGAGERTPVNLRRENYQHVNTGNPLPPEFNAVIKIEDIAETDQGAAIIQAVPPWHNVRTIGESVMKGEQIVTSRVELTPYHLGALLEAGVEEVEVFCRPKVTIIATGDEMVAPGQEPGPGELIDFNSTMISEMARSEGAEVEFAGITADKEEVLNQVILQAADRSDLLIIIAGSSAGSKDFTADIIEENGQIAVHGVDIQPGKPILLGTVSSVPVLGLPGYPLSCLTAFELFGRAAVKNLQQGEYYPPEKITARVKRKLHSKPGQQEFLRVNLSFPIQNDREESPVAVPRRRGSAVMKSQIQADGILEIPAEREGLAADESVEVRLLRPLQQLRSGLVLAGSNDPLLEKLQELLMVQGEGFSLRLQSRGSQAGIHALLRGEIDLTTAHLLDAETGQYNIPYLRQVAEEPFNLLTLAWRDQGLYLPQGNPKEVDSFQDIADKNLNFINRQRGAGTRILFDYQLAEAGLKSGQITGYEREEYTHAAVAQAVAIGAADAGLGIKAVAEAFSLDFLPLFSERFELIYRPGLEKTSCFRSIKKLVESDEFREYLQNSSGYDLKETGLIRRYRAGEGSG
ncbi:MAG: molybdopterin biosynthesis protein [Bacillota bacterium]